MNDDHDWGDEEQEAMELATITYQYALRRLDKGYPDFRFCGALAADAKEDTSLPCPCCDRRIGMWPWQLQLEGRGFCIDVCCTAKAEERERWLKASMGAAYDECWQQRPAPGAEMIWKATMFTS